MKDRYLYRAKRSDNGKWLSGFIYANKIGKHFILPYDYYDDTGLTSANFVDPATVGQCTGLKDKNGNLIFEGDILKSINARHDVHVIYVCWCNSGYLAIGKITHGSEQTYPYFPFGLSEIIGNIHDNPELLE